jgi:hypothetical protein
MCHPFKYLGYWIHINIVHINLTWNSCDFCTSPWKPNFTQNLYKSMKPSKFVMLFLCNLWYELINIPLKTWKCPKIIELWFNKNTTRKNNVYAWSALYITNLMGHDLAIIVMQNLYFIGWYRIKMDVIHLLVLFEYWYHAHDLNTNVICLFVSFKHRCYMSICVVYTWKSYTWLSCLNNAQHSCLTNTNLWNNKFCTHLERTHETCKFVM